MDRDRFEVFAAILKKELVPAMGCTEPIAVAYAAAKAREVLGKVPDTVILKCSGNIIKNVKSVVVPNTDGMKGLKAAAAVGIIGGDASKKLEVISKITKEQKEELKEFVKNVDIVLEVAPTDIIFDVWITLKAGDDKVLLRVAYEHTNIVRIEKNDIVIFDNFKEDTMIKDENPLTVASIYEFADTCELDDLRETIRRQIDYNTAVSEEGLRGNWGANIGSTILKHYDADDVAIRAKAKAAAGSDARMSGCELPVVINSGSGNQGITISIPIIEYAKEYNASEDKLYRALILGNLLGIHQKSGIGCLSAYCGAVSAGCAAGAGIAYLEGADVDQISHLIVNCLAITSGIVCDGAKPSCAGKIAASVDTAILAYNMMKDGQQFRDGEGIVKKGVENTIREVGRLGKEGMRETDKEIIKIMIG